MFNDYLSYLPNFLQGSTQLNAIATALKPQFASDDGQMFNIVKKVENEEYIATATDYGLSIREKILGIIAESENETLDLRRQRISSIMQNQIPFNLQFLKNKLSGWSNNNYFIIIDNSNYTIDISMPFQSISAYDPTGEIKQILPANLLLNLHALYVTWGEINALNLTFGSLDSKKLTWLQFESTYIEVA